MKRTLIVWVVLVALFVAFYQFFAASPHPGQPTAPESPAVRLVATFLPLLILALFGFFFWLALRGSKRGLALNNEGVAFMSQGRHAAALEKFQAALPLLKNQRHLGHYNCGIAQLALWRVEEAERSLETAKKKPRLGADLEPMIAPHLALAHALRPNLEAAQSELARTRALKVENSGSSLVTSAVLAARRGEWPAVLASVDRPEVKQLGGMQRALADTLRAWAAEQTQGARWPVDRVALLNEAGLEKLRAVWPELAQFVERAV